MKEKDLKIEVTEIYNLLDNIGWDLSEAREKLDNLEEEIKHKEKQSIKDINNFKIELKKARLYTEEMEDFIQEHNLDIRPDYGKYPSRPYDSPIVYGDNTKISIIMKEFANE